MSILPRLVRSLAAGRPPRSRDLRRLFPEADDLLEELPRTLARGLGAGVNQHDFAPALDVDQTDKEVVVRAEIPGFARSDVKVEVEGDALTIRGESKEETSTDTKERYFKRVGRFSESFRIPDLAHVAGAEGIKAEMKQGFLVVRVPRTGGAVSGRREIPVVTEGDAGGAPGQHARDTPHTTGHHGHKWNVRAGRDECHPDFQDEGPADRPFGEAPGKDSPKGEDVKVARAAG